MMYNVIMIRTQILLPAALYNQLKVKASTEGRSLSDVVREAIQKLFVIKKKSTRDILLEMVKDGGSNPDTPSDLSTNDDYLYKL